MKTLKYLAGAASLMVAASFAVSPATAGTVTGTKHDLTSFTANAGTEQVCVFCHTPHNGAQGQTADPLIAVYNTMPLWNRKRTGASITAFTTYTSPTLTGVTAGQPAGVSAACLGCHDGVTALDSLIVTAQAAAFSTPGTVMPGGAAVLGADLRNDHPVSITYGTPAADFVAAPTLPLYGASSDQVECGSCHNPHDNDVVAPNASKFLRMSNASSNLCLACHIK